jgi:hypothetical protein
MAERFGKALDKRLEHLSEADRDLIAQLIFHEGNFWYAPCWQYVYDKPCGPELGARIEELVKMRGDVPSAGLAY